MKFTVFQQEGFPSRRLSPGVIQTLAARPEVEIVWQDIKSMLSRGVLGDFFVNGHGEVYPLVLEDPLYEFFQQGGGLFHIGGRPFETALKWENGAWTEHVRTLGDIRDHKGFGPLEAPMDVFRAKLGYTPYELFYPADSLEECAMEFDSDFVGCENVKMGLYDKSLNLATTMQMRLLKPELDLTDHRAYQARPAVRETLFPGTLTAPSGLELSKVLQLTKSWGNPYTKDQTKVLKPWAVYTADAAQEESLPVEILDAMLRFVSCPVFLKEAVLDLASLHQGETAHPHVALTRALPDGFSVRVLAAPVSVQDVRDGKQPEYREIPYQMEAGVLRSFSMQTSSESAAHEQASGATDDLAAVSEELTGACHFGSGAFAACDIPFDKDALLTAIRFEIRDGQGRLCDYLETGVVMWQPEVLSGTVKLTPDGRYFAVEQAGKTQPSRWVSGVNWQDRHLFAFSFHNPNPLRVLKDARDMAACGMKFVRPHYFMPGWFRSVPGTVFEEGWSALYESFEMGPELSERHMRALEAHVMAFGAMGLCYMPSVYTSLGANMGSPSHWMGTSRLFAIRWQIENQKIFARQLMERFGNLSWISWDLINEPDTGMDIAGSWLSEHKEIFGKTGQMIGIGCIGMVDNLLLGESADWHSIHGKTGNCLHLGKPFLLQEAHYPVPSTYEGEDELERRLNSCFANTLRDGGAGIMPWNWNMSFQNWRYRGGWVDFWDLHLGICTHPDATPRRGKVLMRNWETLLHGLCFDQEDDRQVVFVYPKTCLPGKGSYEYLDLLRDKRICFCAVNDRDLIEFDLSKTKLLIFPLYGRGYRRSSYEAAMAFAKAGGVVYGHNENLLLDENGEPDFTRNIPEKPGTAYVGSGRFEWCLGWNFDANFGCPFPDIVRLEKIVDGLALVRRPEGVRHLAGIGKPLTVNRPDEADMHGFLEFEEVFAKGRHGMLYDWSSLEPWQDENETVKVSVKDESGRIVRAWARGGRAISVDGYMFESPQDLFFLREADGTYYLSGLDIRVTGRFESCKARLVSPYGFGGWTDLGIELVPEPVLDGAAFRLDGWKHMYWLEVMLG